MKKHSDCSDCCALYEHKGYPPCEHTSGECMLLEQGDLDCDSETIEDHQRQESRWLDRQNARSINRKVE
jgi:hypothetical protein